MLFNSIEFLIFFPIVTAVFFIIPNRFQKYWLLLSSYFFYMCWNPIYLTLIVGITLIAYISAVLIDKLKKKSFLFVSVALCLSILFFFKYFVFTLSIITSIISRFGKQIDVSGFDIVIPVGISFYTFQAVGYIVDVYRGKTKAEHNFFDFALFISFFPQLVAGPIERSSNLLHQLKSRKEFDYARMVEGTYLILWGLFLKMCIADRAAIFVDNVYNNYDEYQGIFIIVASLLFAIQIYCDFYGYSIIALGAARILGINLSENFKQPYLSSSVKEFWRTWHISLNHWFKDYLYIPLGGSKNGIFRTYINSYIVFFFSGLWHGASFSFVAWGVINWFYQVVEDIIDRIEIRIGIQDLLSKCKVRNICRMLLTFMAIDFSWVFFRAGSISKAIAVLKRAFCNNYKSVLIDGELFSCGLDKSNFVLLFICIMLLLVVDIFNKHGKEIHCVVLQKNYALRLIILLFTVIFIEIFGIYGPIYDENNFIYFQF